MTERPLFLPGTDGTTLVTVRGIEFTWYPGFSPVQKHRSVASMHEAIARSGAASNPLEISTKSPEEEGVLLSAFNLRFRASGWSDCPVETVFQSSKIFERGGPYADMLAMLPRDAKRDPRLRSSGSLTGFVLRGERWGLIPRTVFYDWLYLNALHQNPRLAEAVLGRDGFTDIEFNPKKSVNCQARSAALFVALSRSGCVSDALRTPARYREVVGAAGPAGSTQPSLL